VGKVVVASDSCPLRGGCDTALHKPDPPCPSSSKGEPDRIMTNPPRIDDRSTCHCKAVKYTVEVGPIGPIATPMSERPLTRPRPVKHPCSVHGGSACGAVLPLTRGSR
jgi:hypothetical protein